MSNTDVAKGRVKEALGDLKGDKRLKREGQIDQAAGTAKGKVGRAVDKAAGKAKANLRSR